MTQDEFIEMAREAFACKHCPLPVPEDRIVAFAKLVAEKAVAKERESRFYTIGPNEMLLTLVREYNGRFCHFAYKFSDYEVMNSLDSMPSMVAEKARRITYELNAAIKARGEA